MTIEDLRESVEPIKQFGLADDTTGKVYLFPGDFVPDPYDPDDTVVSLRTYDQALWVKFSFGRKGNE